MKKILPPYARDIERFKHDSDIVICSGSNAYEAAYRLCEYSTAKIVLPPGDDPEAYRWPVSGRYCQIWSCGEPEPQEALFKLARLLLEAGAVKVLLLDLTRQLVIVKPVRRRDV